MNKNDKSIHHIRLTDPEDDTGTESGTQTGGKIEFKDFIGTGQTRDDFLSFEEKKRLFYQLENSHEVRVQKEKDLRDMRKDVKEGRMGLHDYREQLHASSSSQYQSHPTLSQAAQFSGADPETTFLPTDYDSNTNEADYELKNRPQNQPHYTPQNTPRFKPPGG